jgi:HTH-type transcriptional regulator/antitoxin HigA
MTRVLANPAEMIRLGAPRVIRSDKELAEYSRALFYLTAKARPTREERDAIELITLLVERYESERFPIPDAEPAEVLRFLMESNGLSQREIAPVLGSEATVSLVLSGKRRLTLDHIVGLSRRFQVSPAVFFPRSAAFLPAISSIVSTVVAEAIEGKTIPSRAQKKKKLPQNGPERRSEGRWNRTAVLA